MSGRIDDENHINNPKYQRPESVPPLQLNTLNADSNENQTLVNPLKPNPNKSFQTPTSRSIISWGTPNSDPHRLDTKDQAGGTVFRPCTHLQHKRHQQPQRNPITHKKIEITKSPRQKEEQTIKPKKVVITEEHKANKSPKQAEEMKPQNNKSKYWYLDEELKDTPKITPREEEGYSIDEMAKNQANFTGQTYSDTHQLRKLAAENDIASKQKQEIMEQVLIDQLSRHVISDADQDKDPARQNSEYFGVAPLRNKSRKLHDTKVSTANALTESKLKERTTFGAHLATRDGREALRELFGFFFHSDQTLTLYEYRLFGKNTSKALPFIDRGKYSHVTGRRKGKAYQLHDFQIGRNLSFLTSNQPHLPDSIKKHSVVSLRIFEVNQSQQVPYWEADTTDREGSDTALEQNDRKITANIQKLVRGKIRGRSVSVVVGLGRLFRLIDSSGDGCLNKQELRESLKEFDIQLPEKEFDSVWRVVDENNDGSIDYGEFVKAFIGEMNETRKGFVRKVFKKLDPRKSGEATFLDVQKIYSVKKHPLVLNGQFTESEMLDQFMEAFSPQSARNKTISFVEFEDYYEGLSIVVEKDEDFINLLRNCWGI